MPREENIAALKQAAERFKARDLDGHLKLYNPSLVHHGFSKRLRTGLAGLREHYEGLLKAFPDMRIDADDMLADGEKVLHRFHFSGTHKADYMGFPASGKMVRAAGYKSTCFGKARRSKSGK
jgi:predicted ester cyclase